MPQEPLRDYDPTFVDVSRGPTHGQTLTIPIEQPLASARPGGSMPIGSKGAMVASPGQVPSEPIGGPNLLSAIFGGRGPNVTTPSLRGSADPNDIYRELTQALDPNLVERGISPTSSGHAMGLPPSMTTPVEGFNPYPMDQRPVVGAGNARARGIGNAITGVANAIGSFTVAKQQRDQRTLAGSTTRLIQAQQGIDQAKQTLQDPGITAETKKTMEGIIEKNTTTMNDILADDKTRKGVEKGFNISFTDPSKNQTGEHKGVAQGMQEAQKSFAEQFAAKMPEQVGPNVMAQQRLQFAMQQQAAQQKLLGAVLPRMLSAQSAMERTRYVQYMQGQRQLDQHIFEAEKLGQTFSNSKAMAEIRHTYRLDEIQANAKAMGQRLVEAMQLNNLDPVSIFKMETNFTNQAAQEENRLKGMITQTLDYINALNVQIGNEKDSTIKQQLIDDRTKATHDNEVNQQMLDNYQVYKTKTYGVFQNLKNIGAATGGNPNAGPSTQNTGGAGGPAGTGMGLGSTDPTALLSGTSFLFGGGSPLPDDREQEGESEDDE